MLFWLLTISYFAISLKSKAFLRFIRTSFTRDVNNTPKCSVYFSKIFPIYLFFLGNELLLVWNQVLFSQLLVYVLAKIVQFAADIFYGGCAINFLKSGL